MKLKLTIEIEIETREDEPDPVAHEGVRLSMGTLPQYLVELNQRNLTHRLITTAISERK